MHVRSAIQFVPHDKIDKVKWDHCIDTAPNGLIYAYSFYLDLMADRWDALVMDDYEAVMPLTGRKKHGIHYLSQPFLTAQLGVFGKKVDPGALEIFLNSIPSHFKYWDFYLNHGNVFQVAGFNLYERNNHVLDLRPDYNTLYNNYRDNIRRNIKKAGAAGFTTTKDAGIDEVIRLAWQQMKDHTSGANANMDRFRKLYQLLKNKGMATVYGILSEKKQIVSSAVFFISHQRAYYILVGNHPDGKLAGASHALIDSFIRDHAGKELLLDFEGSDIPNLALFYRGFGAKEEKYAAIRLNKLPFYLKWLKR